MFNELYGIFLLQKWSLFVSLQRETYCFCNILGFGGAFLLSLCLAYDSAEYNSDLMLEALLGALIGTVGTLSQPLLGELFGFTFTYLRNFPLYLILAVLLHIPFPPQLIFLIMSPHPQTTHKIFSIFLFLGRPMCLP